MNPDEPNRSSKAGSLELLYALNAVATALQKSIQSEEDVYAVFQSQIVTLGLRGGIGLLDDERESLAFKAVAFTNPLKKFIGRFESRLKTRAEGFSIRVDRVDVYQEVVTMGETIFVPDTSTILGQVISRQTRSLVRPLLAVLGQPPGIYTPLVFGGTIKGMLNIVGPKLTEGDIPTVKAFANQIAVALENARLVQRLQSANEELQFELAELERFTYAVSHELKTPLVTIKGFLGSIKKDLREENYERVHQDLVRISTATDRMRDTLAGLLDLSRIGHIPYHQTEVDLSQLARDAVENMSRARQARAIKFVISSDLPVVYGDRDRLMEVFENLLDNAAKFTEDEPDPCIEIGLRNNGDGKVVFVRDNGMGIDPSYHAKVFGLFEKLDAKRDGAGVGLAVVKRIVETHGGQVWVESDGLGKGSTFCFTLSGGNSPAL